MFRPLGRKSIEADAARLRVYLNQAATPISACSLIVVEEDGTPSASAVSTIRVSNGTLTEHGDGVVSIDLTGCPLTVSDSASTALEVSPVHNIKFPEGRVNDLGNDSVYIDIPEVLTVANADDSVRVFPTTEIRFMSGSVVDFGDGNVRISFTATATITLTAGSGLTGGGSGSSLSIALDTPGTLSVVSGNSAGGAAPTSASVTAGSPVSTSSASSSLTAVIPTAASAGEMLLALIATQGSSASVTTVPDGWTHYNSASQTNVKQHIYTRVARAGDAGSDATFGFNSTFNAAAVILRLPGSYDDLGQAFSAQANAGSVNLTCPSITPTTNYSLILTLGCWGAGGSVSPDADTTELVDKVSTAGSLNVGIHVAYYSQTTAASTGTQVHTISGSAGNIGAQMAVPTLYPGVHQHILATTYRPGAESLIQSDSGGGLSLAYLGLGNGTLGAEGRQLTMKYSASDVGMQLRSVGGSGKSYAMVSNTDGHLIIQDDEDASPSIKLLEAGYIAMYPDVGKGVIIGPTGGGAVANSTLETEETITLSSACSYGRAAAITFDPGYSGASAVTKHIYMEFQNVSTANSASVTDAVVGYFNANAGTHEALDSGTTKSSPGTVSAWLKFDINGTLYYVPAYTSKTS